jgi:hypothetical protein
MEPKPSHMLCTCSSAEMHCQPICGTLACVPRELGHLGREAVILAVELEVIFSVGTRRNG